jgi:nitrite reductase (NADH) large subunit
VVAFREIEDARAMIEQARCGRHAVVIGGGLLGLEAASGLAVRGMKVTVLHRAAWLMERQLDAAAATLLHRSMRFRGLDILLAAHAEALVGDGDSRVTGVRLRDGTQIAADLVVVAAGTRPNTALAERAGLHCDRGIVVHDSMQAITDPRIYAVGECAAHRGVAYGLVAPAYEQAQVCANHLARSGVARYRGSKVSTKLKVSGDHVFSAGNFMGAATGRQEDARCEEIVLSDPDAGIYTKLVIRDDKLVGACLIGDVGDGAYFTELLREGRPIEDIRDTLMFGRPDIEARTGATVC